MTMPALGAITSQQQQQTLSPRLQHAVRLLHMSSADFAQTLADALQRNPFLEVDGADGTLLPANEGEPVPEDDGDGPGWDDGRAPGRAAGDRPHDDDTAWMDTMAVERTLADHLHGQLDVLPLPERDRALAKAIVESLDDDGYLRTPLDEVLDDGALDLPLEAGELEIALARVQALEPAGVGARSVQEALLLQLPEILCPDERALAQDIVRAHVERLAANDLGTIARRLRRPLAEVERACARIRHLDPRPGWRYGAARVQYVTPDVIVKKRRGVWTTVLNPAIVPRLRMNRVIEELYRRQRRQARHAADGMTEQLQEARWTLRNVEQRFATILGVAEAIVERQREFLEYGPMAMKPLALREIAQKVGVHESTVSRVTHDKYMATPSGTFELKYFFSRPMATASGGACSPTALRGLIRTMIEAETPGDPLSDAELARQLARQGLIVARRTVTKYRQLLKFEPAERRRRAA